MPAVIVFIFLGIVLVYQKVLDFLQIPKSTLSYAKVILKERVGIKSESTPSKLFTIHKICFELDNHKILDLPVPRKTYESVAIGSRGVLVHTYTRCRDFHVGKKIPDIVDTRKKSVKSNRKNKNGWRRD
jgi:hypothetical protein